MLKLKRNLLSVALASATLLIAMGGYKEGEEQAKEVIKLAPQDANGYLMYAGMYMKQNKPAD